MILRSLYGFARNVCVLEIYKEIVNLLVFFSRVNIMRINFFHET